MKRSTRKEIAQETLHAIESGHYPAPSGRIIDLQDDLDRCKRRTICYEPNEITGLLHSCAPTKSSTAEISVVNETTIAGAQGLLSAGAGNVVCLNFASAKNPGGGFLGGAEAQEEAISRPSALYASLLTAQRAYYEPNRASANALYTDRAIYSPDVPVFRNEEGTFLEEPYLLSFVTAPAPNRGAIEHNSPKLIPQIEPTFRRRILNTLAIMANHGHRHIVLGAWGCGVFRNSSLEVARWFYEALVNQGWQSHFDHIRFSVLDRRDDGTFDAFAQQFATTKGSVR